MDIRYVQSMKNTSHHAGLNQTPYKAKFCTDPRTGLPFATLPGEAIKRLETMTFCLSSLQTPGNSNLLSLFIANAWKQLPFVSLHCKRLETMTFCLSLHCKRLETMTFCHSSLQTPGNCDRLSLSSLQTPGNGELLSLFIAKETVRQSPRQSRNHRMQ